MGQAIKHPVIVPEQVLIEAEAMLDHWVHSLLDEDGVPKSSTHLRSYKRGKLIRHHLKIRRLVAERERRRVEQKNTAQPLIKAAGAANV